MLTGQRKILAGVFDDEANEKEDKVCNSPMVDCVSYT